MSSLRLRLTVNAANLTKGGCGPIWLERETPKKQRVIVAIAGEPRTSAVFLQDSFASSISRRPPLLATNSELVILYVKLIMSFNDKMFRVVSTRKRVMFVLIFDSGLSPLGSATP